MAAAGVVDVVVVGGGVVGTAAAWQLAVAGASVRLVERTAIAAGASGRNSGVVWHPPDPVLEQLYDETLALLRDAEAAAPATGFRLAPEPVGILALTPDADAARDEALAVARTTPRYRPRFVDAAELRTLEPCLAPGLAAVRLDIGFPVAPWAATRALADLAARHGAQVEERAPVRLARSGDRVTGVVTDDGRRIDGGAVIVAAGPWTPELIDPTGTWQPIRRAWGVVVELELSSPPRHVLEGAGIDAAIAPGTPPTDAGGEDVHFSLATADGRSSLGSTFLAAEPDPDTYEPRLRAQGATYLPAIAETPTRSRRTCARPLALDGRPLVGAVPGTRGLYVAAGHGPWGLSTGAASGRHVAGLALGQTDALPGAVRAALDPGRFGPIPG